MPAALGMRAFGLSCCVLACWAVAFYGDQVLNLAQQKPPLVGKLSTLHLEHFLAFRLGKLPVFFRDDGCLGAVYHVFMHRLRKKAMFLEDVGSSCCTSLLNTFFVESLLCDLRAILYKSCSYHPVFDWRYEHILFPQQQFVDFALEAGFVAGSDGHGWFAVEGDVEDGGDGADLCSVHNDGVALNVTEALGVARDRGIEYLNGIVSRNAS